jgi:hypothetical protein
VPQAWRRDYLIIAFTHAEFMDRVLIVYEQTFVFLLTKYYLSHICPAASSTTVAVSRLFSAGRHTKDHGSVMGLDGALGKGPWLFDDVGGYSKSTALSTEAGFCFVALIFAEDGLL